MKPIAVIYLDPLSHTTRLAPQRVTATQAVPTVEVF